MYVTKAIPTTNSKFKIPILWQAILWKFLSIACFAGINAFVRYYSGGSPLVIKEPFPIYAIIFFQNIFGILILTLIAFATKQTNKLLSPKTPRLHIIRLVLAMSGLYLWYLSFRYLPLIQVVALSFLGPIFTIAGSKLFLKETFNWQKITALALSIIGGFLIVRPDIGINSNCMKMTFFLPILATIIFAGDKIVARKIMSNKESSFTLSFYLLAASVLLCSIPCILFGFPKVKINQIPNLILLGTLCACAHLTFNKAYKLAQVSFLLPFSLSKCVLCGIIGYMAFEEIPDAMVIWIGIIVVLLSSFILNFNFKYLDFIFKKKSKAPAVSR